MRLRDGWRISPGADGRGAQHNGQIFRGESGQAQICCSVFFFFFYFSIYFFPFFFVFCATHKIFLFSSDILGPLQDVKKSVEEAHRQNGTGNKTFNKATCQVSGY